MGIKKVKSDTVDAEVVYYRPDSTVQSRYYIKDSLYHGEFEVYFRNGLLDHKGRMYEGRKKGTVSFYDSATGKLRKYINYVLIGDGDSSLVNEVIYFDVNGNLDSNALNIYYQTAVPRDTISVNERFEFSLKVTQPYFTTSRMIICDFDEFYNVADGSSCGSKMMENGEITLGRSDNSIGLNVVRGVIISSEPNSKYKEDMKGGRITTYFEVPYFVKSE